MDNLKKAKVRLILSQPFFAYLMQQLDFREDSNIETLTTDGKTLEYNPEYINTLSVEQITGSLAHIIMHLAMLHHLRRSGRILHLWNVATDLAINPVLRKSGFTLPEGYIYEKDLENMSSEAIYELLIKELQDNPPGFSTSNSPDYVMVGNIKDPEKGANLKELEGEMKRKISQAINLSKGRGNLPAGIEEIIKDILAPKINWQESLNRFIIERANNDYKWNKPNRRYLYYKVFLPTLENFVIGKLIIILDTSGSIRQADLNQFSGEILDITTTFHITVQVIYVDTEVQGIQEIDPDEPFILKPKGRGGTDFRPGFNYIEENDLEPCAVIYITDGDCTSFPDEPDYPVLWAQFGYRKFTPPFGEVIQVTQ